MGGSAAFKFASCAFRKDPEALSFRTRWDYVLWVRDLCCSEARGASPGPALVLDWTRYGDCSSCYSRAVCSVYLACSLSGVPALWEREVSVPLSRVRSGRICNAMFGGELIASALHLLVTGSIGAFKSCDIAYYVSSV